MPQTPRHASGPPSGGTAPFSEQERATIAALEETVGVRFHDPRWLLEALTHRSYAYEATSPGVAQNERLEFLGDAVLGYIAASLLFTRAPEADEGKLTTLRAALIRTTTLAQLARELHLGEHLRLGRGHSWQTIGDRVLASTFEAVVGALQCDGGLASAEAFAGPLLLSQLERVLREAELKDDKTRLQDLAQMRLGHTPRYRMVSSEGPAHEPRFVVEVLLGEVVAGSGEGRTKRQAEQAAARRALEDPGWERPALHDEETAGL
jgi:ribonuclease-3